MDLIVTKILDRMKVEFCADSFIILVIPDGDTPKIVCFFTKEVPILVIEQTVFGIKIKCTILAEL